MRLINISNNNKSGDFVVSDVKQIEVYDETHRPSVKMVLSGIEDYNVNGNRYKLNTYKFLLVDKHSKIDLTINDQSGVHGVCIFPKDTIVNDVYRNKSNRCEELLNNPFDTENFNFLEKAYAYGENRTGAFLKNNTSFILNSYDSNNELDFDAFYLSLAECLVTDQLELEGYLKNLSSARKSTKEELYRRVSGAKGFIEDNYKEKICLDEVAQNACLSKYHFVRSFKSLYRISPIQYLLHLRLNKANELLQKDYSYAQVTDLVGFSDVKNLRKAIKKNFYYN